MTRSIRAGASFGFFEDFVVSQRLRHGRAATIGEVEGSFIAKQVMNTAQGHWNEHHLFGSPVGSGRVVFGLITASVVFGLAGADTAQHVLTELGCTGLRFRAPVHHGDTLHAFTEVLSVEPAPQRTDSGIVRFKHWGVTHHGTLVFEGERSLLVKRRSHWATQGEAQ